MEQYIYVTMRLATMQLRNYATMQLRNYATTQLRNYAIV